MLKRLFGNSSPPRPPPPPPPPARVGKERHTKCLKARRMVEANRARMCQYCHSREFRYHRNVLICSFCRSS